MKVEAWALTQAAQIMMAAQRDADRERVLEAARLNWRLWTIFQAELSSPDSPVPDQIRSDMLSLCNFVDQHTVGILRAGQPDQLTVLININRNIASGQIDGARASDAAAVAMSQAAVEGGALKVSI